MQLGEIIATYDVDLALRGETGKFEVTSPNGDIHYVTCRPNRFLAKGETSANQIYPRAFLIRKIAELLADEAGEADAAMARDNHTPVSTPFLLESRHDAEKLSLNADCGATMPDSSRANADEVCCLDLSYSANGAQTERPCAFVYVKSGQTEYPDAGARKLMTAPCGSFTELDAEIRKLHAQLDEICLRAKKNFYRAYAAAASA